MSKLVHTEGSSSQLLASVGSSSQLLPGTPERPTAESNDYILSETKLPTTTGYEDDGYLDIAQPVVLADRTSAVPKLKESTSSRRSSYRIDGWTEKTSSDQLLPRGLLSQYSVAFPNDKDGSNPNSLVDDLKFKDDSEAPVSQRRSWILFAILMLAIGAGVVVAVLMTSSGSSTEPSNSSSSNDASVDSSSGSSGSTTPAPPVTYTTTSFLDVDYDQLLPTPDASRQLAAQLKKEYARQAGIAEDSILSVALSRGSVIVTLTVLNAVTKTVLDSVPQFCMDTRLDTVNFELCVNPVKPNDPAPAACEPSQSPCLNNARCMSTSQEPICGCQDGWQGSQCDIPGPMPSGVAVLPSSKPRQLLHLVKDCEGASLGLARSFDGSDWEPILPGLPGRVTLECNPTECSVTLPESETTYCIKEVDLSGVPTSSEAKAARLLSQATFGAPRRDIDHVVNDLGNSAEAWVAEQQSLPATYLREYYRTRLNPKQLVADPLGRLRGACEVGSRWHSFAFEFLDEGLEVTVMDGFVTVGWFAFFIHGTLITEVNEFELGAGVYTVCDVVEYRGVGGAVQLSADGCDTKVTIENPLIHFESPNPEVLDFSLATLATHPVRGGVVFLDAPLPSCTEKIFNRFTMMTNGSAFFRHDPRVKLRENTLDSPADVTEIGETCPAVVPNFLNKNSCERRPSCSQPVFESVPVPLNNETLRVWFEQSHKYLYYVTGLRLEDPFDVSPCVSGFSRWLRTSGNCEAPTTTMDPDTLVTIATALAAATDPNPFVRDIQLSGANCTDSSSTIGAQIQVEGECFEHVHPHLYDVRDFSYWVLIHDGNDAAASADRPNPIAKWADQGLTYLEYPWHHPMSRFASQMKHIPFVGRFGDSLDFTQMSTDIQTLEIANYVGATVSAGTDGFEACGSRKEVRNEPKAGHWYPAGSPSSSDYERGQLDWPVPNQGAKSMVWTNVVFNSKDQLRQRVAWVLSQILVTSDTIGYQGETEVWATYYDIFVKHAFGSYRDILREVTYSPVMGAYLSYRQNKAFASARTFPDENYAREIMQLFSIGLWKLGDDGIPETDDQGKKMPTYTNEDIVAFARIWTGFDRHSQRPNYEAENGESSGNLIDPMFIKPEWRDPFPKTKLDEGYIGDGYPSCHDLPPQHFLREGATYEFLGETSLEGDKVDRFAMLPDEVFEAEVGTTVVGARRRSTYVEFRNEFGDYIEWKITRDTAETVSLRAYYYLTAREPRNRPVNLTVNGVVVNANWDFPTSFSAGRLRSNDPMEIDLVAGVNTIRLSTNGYEDQRIDFIAFGGDGAIRKRLEPNPDSSELYVALCGASPGSPCAFPAQVTLSSNLACDGDECNAGRVIIVAMEDKIGGVRRYYRYVPRPCVRYPVFDKGHVTTHNSGTLQQCTADNMEKSVSCCFNGTDTRLPVDLFATCLYSNEAVNYETAQQRCAARDGSLCATFSGTNYFHTSCAEDAFSWTAKPCSPKIQIYPDGYIGLIDPATGATDTFWEYMESSRNNFRIRWSDPTSIPLAANGCGSGCQVVQMAEGDTCVCEIQVEESVPFTTEMAVPSVADISTTLFIGSVAPSVYDSGMYVECSNPAFCTADVRVWTLASNSSQWDRDTIFEIPPRVAGGAKQYLKNRVSMVKIAGQPESSFRSPPSFMPSLGEQSRYGVETYLSFALLVPEAEYEVEATLDHFFEHPSTGPFVSLRLIQQMVTSNPSPKYVERVVTAFKTGKFGNVGSGKYGDLQATVAAVLLDKEARTGEYDAEPLFGHGFEPIMKVLSILRVLEWEPSYGQQLALSNAEGKIGMETFNAPSVFGYYRPEFVAEGAIADAGVVSPELELAQQPLLIGYLNGMVSLINRGLSSCSDGFGYLCRGLSGNYEGPLASVLTSSDPKGVVDELALLLTQDRMHNSTRQIIAEAYTRVEEDDGPEDALKVAQKLVLSSPEFHMSPLNKVTEKPQPEPVSVPSQGRKFKAIVLLFEAGGCDSFNLLVPKDRCRDGHDYYGEYAKVRTNGALARSDLLDIEIPSGTQPCDTFGVNSHLPIFKQLHDNKEGGFVANIGALVEPVTKEEYKKGSKRLPPSLFAHNAQQRAFATVDSENTNAKGVLGRTVQALLDQAVPYRSELYSMSGNQRLLEGSTQVYDIIDRRSGVETFNEYKDLHEDLLKLTANVSGSAFADTYSKLLRSSLAKTEALGNLLDETKTETTFADDDVSEQFEQVSKLVKLRDELQTERAVFVVRQNRFDSHNTFDLSEQFGEINTGLTSFVNEMKKQGVWNDVVFFTVSDFGRTLTSNGQGSDHAWGGNHFVAGGQINGGKMFGKFPDTLEADGELYVGRGRVIPTLPWEGIWEGIIEWFGVDAGQKATVLPNLFNFGPEQRYDSSELFVNRVTPTSTNYVISWTIPSNPGTLTIKPGDNVTFTWSGYHDLVQTTTQGCDFSGSTELAAPASAGSYVWTPPAKVMEAEEAKLVSGAELGLLYVTFTSSGQYVEFETKSSTAQQVLLSAGFYNGGSAKTLELSVNGVIVNNNWSFPGAGDWKTKLETTASVSLIDGKNVIRVTSKGNTGIQLDKLSYGLGDYNFACTVAGHCSAGMKLHVTVAP